MVMAVREVTGKDYLKARRTYNKWAAKQRFPKTFKDWMRDNVGVQPKKYQSIAHKRDELGIIFTHPVSEKRQENGSKPKRGPKRSKSA